MNILAFAGGTHRIAQIGEPVRFLRDDPEAARNSRGQAKNTGRKMGKRPSNGWHAQIQKRAYALWEREGRPDGRDVAHWLHAEAEIEGARFADWPEHIVCLPAAEGEARHRRIQERAYALWEQEGRPESRQLDHWLRAQTEDGAF